MMLRQETCKEERKVPVTPPVVASNTGLENQYLLPADSTQTGSDLSGHSTQQLPLCTYEHQHPAQVNNQQPSEDWLVFSPYLYGKRISWKVVWANQKGGGVGVGVVGVK